MPPGLRVTGAALAAAAAAVLLGWIVHPWLRHETPYAVLLAAVAVAAAVAGWAGGLTTAGVCGVAAELLFVDPATPGPQRWLSLALYVVASLVIVVIAGELRRARGRAVTLQRRSAAGEQRLEAEAAGHRRTEATLRHEQELLHNVFDTIPVMISVFEPGGRRLRLNREYERRLGWSAADLDVVELMRRVFPDPAVRARAWQFMQNGTGWTDIPMQTRDGAVLQTRWARFRLSDGSDVAIGLDVTEQVRAAEELRISERRFQHVADEAPVMIWMTGPDKACTWVNRRWTEFTGRPLADHLGEGWTGSIHPDDRERMFHLFSATSDARAPFASEFRVLRHDGAVRWMHTEGRPQFDSGGGFAGYIGTILDVTDRKLTEERLTSADRAKDEFLATLAHELRNPLAPIRNALEIIRRAPGGASEAARAREIIERQVRQMSRLVDDLLDVSRITRGIVTLRRERVRLDRVVHEAVEACRPRIEAAGHHFDLRMPDAPVVLDADPARVSQVVANLLDNAAKYTPPPGHIRLEARIEGGGVELRVTDTGIGIARDHLPRLFEMFTRGGVLDRAQGGLGIGLWLSRRLVDLHGGTLAVESAGPGRGSTFVMRLPIPADQSPGPAPPPAASPAGPAPSPARVLVVEDNRDSAETLEILLRLMGHEVHVAADGAAGLRMACEVRPDVALLDIGLPEMSGYEVARRIRLEPWGARIGLVALTGWGQEEDKRRSRGAGFDHHLTKPVDPAQLGTLIETFMVPPRRHAPNAGPGPVAGSELRDPRG